MKKTIKAILTIGIAISFLASCANATEIPTLSINKNITIDAKIASIDAYGNITLNILTKDLLTANFNYNNKVLIQFSNGYLVESNLTASNNNLNDGQCYIRTVSEDTPITVGIKTNNLAEIGTLKIGDIVKISQLIAN
jgi:S-adenosylmethionine hydrolase